MVFAFLEFFGHQMCVSMLPAERLLWGFEALKSSSSESSIFVHVGTVMRTHPQPCLQRGAGESIPGALARNINISFLALKHCVGL